MNPGRWNYCVASTPCVEVVLWYADLIYCDLAWVASVEDCGEGKEAARTLWTTFMSIRKQI